MSPSVRSPAMYGFVQPPCTVRDDRFGRVRCASESGAALTCRDVRFGPNCKDRVISVLAPITDSVSTMRDWSYLPARKEQLLAPPNRPRLAENKRSGSALRSQCRRGDDVVAGPPEQQRHDGAV